MSAEADAEFGLPSASATCPAAMLRVTGPSSVAVTVTSHTVPTAEVSVTEVTLPLVIVNDPRGRSGMDSLNVAV